MVNDNQFTITELDEQQLQRVANMNVGKAAILFTTPLCGTCKVAVTMLNVLAETGVPYRLYQSNINFTPYFRELWQIKSIPSLVIIENGQVVDTLYAMHSVSALYERFTSTH